MGRLCECCEMEIPAARLAAVPHATLCVICQKVRGDVAKVTGYMSWSHKTAPEIIIGKDAEVLRQYDRRGFHAQLPLASKENPRVLASLGTINLSEVIKLDIPEEDANVEPASFMPSRCHPDRPRINPQGDCLECAAAWYAQRKRIG